MTMLISSLIVIAIAIVIIQISKMVELVSILKGEEKVREESTNILGYMLIGFLVTSFIYFWWVNDDLKKFILPEASSAHGKYIDNMFGWTLFFTGIIFILTQALLFWFAFKYRYNKNRKGYFFPDHHKLELWWTIIPAIVLITLTIMGVNRWVHVMVPQPKDIITITVEATGMQFNWMLRYPGSDGMLGQKNYKLINETNQLGIDFENKLGTDFKGKINPSLDDIIVNELHLPVGKNVLVKINSRDVIHSFYLPHFRVKMDAVPGIPTQFWFTPIKTTEQMRKELNNPDFNYELACAEICGKGHFSMKKIVVVESEEDYNKWLSTQKSYYESVIKPAMTEENKTVDLKDKKKVSSL